MLRTRLWMGALLVFLGLGLVVLDHWLAPWYPFLLLVLLTGLGACCLELLDLLGPARRLPAWFCLAAVLLLIAANWPAHVLAAYAHVRSDPWHWVLGTFTALVLTAFLV